MVWFKGTFTAEHGLLPAQCLVWCIISSKAYIYIGSVYVHCVSICASILHPWYSHDIFIISIVASLPAPSAVLQVSSWSARLAAARRKKPPIGFRCGMMGWWDDGMWKSQGFPFEKIVDDPHRSVGRPSEMKPGNGQNMGWYLTHNWQRAMTLGKVMMIVG